MWELPHWYADRTSPPLTMERSRFGLNLLSQFVLSLLLLGFSSQLPIAPEAIVSAAGLLLLVLFGFGVLYGCFRLMGVRSSGCEWFYQSFPFGMTLSHVGSDAIKEIGSDHTNHAAHHGEGFDWKSLCSFKTLRYAGVILIISAVFSLLFNIEWTLVAKISTAGILGVVFFVGAEWLKTIHKRSMASMSSLIGFALLQFTLTLLLLYAIEQNWNPLLQNPHTWLTLKFLFSCLCLFTLWRYPSGEGQQQSDIHPVLYFAIAYVSPLTLLYSGASLAFPLCLVFVAGMSAMLLLWSGKSSRPSLMLLNAIFANTYIAMLYTQEEAAGNPIGMLALTAYGAFFIVQLIAAISAAQRRPTITQVEYLHLIAIHTFVVLGLLQLPMELDFLRDNIGFGMLAVAFVAFCGSMIAQQQVPDKRFNEILLNLSIILSAAGLFLQTQGPWSAVIFLLYACAILWYSLYTPSIRTRVYGFLILGVAMVKVYLQFSEVFDSIPGSVAILLIGTFLVGLSYKFEAVKGLVVEGLHKDHA